VLCYLICLKQLVGVYATHQSPRDPINITVYDMSADGAVLIGCLDLA
jgi:hypothetical protein